MPKPTVRRDPTPAVNQPLVPESSPEREEIEFGQFQTEPNEFGLYRVYTTLPSVDPEENIDLNDVCDAPGLATTPSHMACQSWWSSFGAKLDAVNHAANNIFAPFLNVTVFRLMYWFHSGSNDKSLAGLNSLVKDVINPVDFEKAHLDNFSAQRELQRLDDVNDNAHPFSNENVWKNSTVRIPLPAEGVKHVSEEAAPILEVPGVHHRSLLEVITTAFQDKSAVNFHYTPHSLFWKPTPESEPERVITDLFNADAFIEEHKTLLKQPPEPGPPLEIGIAAIMAWSDSTHLADFGNASLWPIYLYFGNQSKYSRAKPSNFAAHHVAYMPSVRPHILT